MCSLRFTRYDICHMIQCLVWSYYNIYNYQSPKSLKSNCFPHFFGGFPNMVESFRPNDRWFTSRCCCPTVAATAATTAMAAGRWRRRWRRRRRWVRDGENGGQRMVEVGKKTMGTKQELHHIYMCIYIYNIVSCYIWCDVLCSYIIVDRWYLWGRLVRYGHSMKL